MGLLGTEKKLLHRRAPQPIKVSAACRPLSQTQELTGAPQKNGRLVNAASFVLANTTFRPATDQALLSSAHQNIAQRGRSNCRFHRFYNQQE